MGLFQFELVCFGFYDRSLVGGWVCLERPLHGSDLSPLIDASTYSPNFNTLPLYSEKNRRHKCLDTLGQLEQTPPCRLMKPLVITAGLLAPEVLA